MHGTSREVIHRTKLFGGRETAEEVHSRLGMSKPCQICGGRPVIMIKVLMQHDEFVKRSPELAAEIARTNPNGPYIPTFATTYGPMVLVSKVTACRLHQKELEKTAAKAPSYCLIEIDRGPGADKIQVSVLDNIERLLH